MDVSPHVLDNIAPGIKHPFGLGAVVTLSNGKAVHSDDFKQAYFVAANWRGGVIKSASGS